MSDGEMARPPPAPQSVTAPDLRKGLEELRENAGESPFYLFRFFLYLRSTTGYPPALIVIVKVFPSLTVFAVSVPSAFLTSPAPRVP